MTAVKAVTHKGEPVTHNGEPMTTTPCSQPTTNTEE
jgi:hypothetical protein